MTPEMADAALQRYTRQVMEELKLIGVGVDQINTDGQQFLIENFKTNVPPYQTAGQLKQLCCQGFYYGGEQADVFYQFRKHGI